MSVIGWHTVRVPGGLTAGVISAVDGFARWLKDHGATQVHVVKISEDTYRVMDYWPDRATHAAMETAAVAGNSYGYIDSFHGAIVSGQHGNGDIVSSH